MTITVHIPDHLLFSGQIAAVEPGSWVAGAERVLIRRDRDAGLETRFREVLESLIAGRIDDEERSRFHPPEHRAGSSRSQPTAPFNPSSNMVARAAEISAAGAADPSLSARVVGRDTLLVRSWRQAGRPSQPAKSQSRHLCASRVGLRQARPIAETWAPVNHVVAHRSLIDAHHDRLELGRCHPRGSSWRWIRRHHGEPAQVMPQVARRDLITWTSMPAATSQSNRSGDRSQGWPEVEGGGERGSLVEMAFLLTRCGHGATGRQPTTTNGMVSTEAA